MEKSRKTLCVMCHSKEVKATFLDKLPPEKFVTNFPDGPGSFAKYFKNSGCKGNPSDYRLVVCIHPICQFLWNNKGEIKDSQGNFQEKPYDGPSCIHIITPLQEWPEVFENQEILMPDGSWKLMADIMNDEDELTAKRCKLDTDNFNWECDEYEYCSNFFHFSHRPIGKDGREQKKARLQRKGAALSLQSFDNVHSLSVSPLIERVLQEAEFKVAKSVAELILSKNYFISQLEAETEKYFEFKHEVDRLKADPRVLLEYVEAPTELKYVKMPESV